VDYSYQHGAVKTKVQPKETEVYVDGYLAGIVDDFDGAFQKLYVPPGEHEIVLRLEGYRVYKKNIHVNSGRTFNLRHQMEPLGSGESMAPAPEPPKQEPPPKVYRDEAPRPPRVEERTTPSPPTPPSPPRTESRRTSSSHGFGTLSLRVQPEDAEIFIDGELWGSMVGFEQLVVHLPEGRHRIEIRRAGFQSFTTEVEIRRGEATPLNVKLDGAGI
jgi:hypothetical protein